MRALTRLDAVLAAGMARMRLKAPVARTGMDAQGDEGMTVAELEALANSELLSQDELEQMAEWKEDQDALAVPGELADMDKWIEEANQVSLSTKMEVLRLYELLNNQYKTKTRTEWDERLQMVARAASMTPTEIEAFFLNRGKPSALTGGIPSDTYAPIEDASSRALGPEKMAHANEWIRMHNNAVRKWPWKTAREAKAKEWGWSDEDAHNFAVYTMHWKKVVNDKERSVLQKFHGDYSGMQARFVEEFQRLLGDVLGDVDLSAQETLPPAKDLRGVELFADETLPPDDADVNAVPPDVERAQRMAAFNAESAKQRATEDAARAAVARAQTKQLSQADLLADEPLDDVPQPKRKYKPRAPSSLGFISNDGSLQRKLPETESVFDEALASAMARMRIHHKAPAVVVLRTGMDAEKKTMKPSGRDLELPGPKQLRDMAEWHDGERVRTASPVNESDLQEHVLTTYVRVNDEFKTKTHEHWQARLEMVAKEAKMSTSEVEAYFLETNPYPGALTGGVYGVDYTWEDKNSEALGEVRMFAVHQWTEEHKRAAHIGSPATRKALAKSWGWSEEEATLFVAYTTTWSNRIRDREKGRLWALLGKTWKTPHDNDAAQEQFVQTFPLRIKEMRSAKKAAKTHSSLGAGSSGNAS
tara:strand:+ start:510 stop:2447 length:1938 start_codon:yes stop_codon:yes gene_type:complete